MKAGKEGVSGDIYARKIPGTNLQMNRTDCQFSDCSSEQFVAYMKNIEANLRDDPYMKELKVLAYREDGLPT